MRVQQVTMAVYYVFGAAVLRRITCYLESWNKLQFFSVGDLLLWFTMLQQYKIQGLAPQCLSEPPVVAPPDTLHAPNDNNIDCRHNL